MPVPDDHARDGSLCGRRSAYNRSGVAAPKCYVRDVSAGEIATVVRDARPLPTLVRRCIRTVRAHVVSLRCQLLLGALRRADPHLFELRA
jgi:hypothetical protein